jgi:hypothetical protein
MKRILIFLLLCSSVAFSKNITEEAKHFVFNGDEKDITQEVVNFCEEYYNIFSLALSKELDQKIVINIYPDIKAFHESMSKKNPQNIQNTTDFFTGYSDSRQKTIDIVSPYNPGTIHRFSSIKGAIIADIEESFLVSYYDLPKWLLKSIHTYRRWEIINNGSDCSDLKNKDHESYKRIIQDENNFKLANLKTENDFQIFQEKYLIAKNKEEIRNREYDKKNINNSFVHFIINNYGYEYLLKDKDICEILSIKPEELEKKWFEFTKLIINN